MRPHRTRKGLPRSLPAELVAEMYAFYQAGHSLAEVGRKYDRSRQSVYAIFCEHRDLPLRARHFHPVIEFEGRRFTEQVVDAKGRDRRHRYLRATVRRKGQPMYLHHLVWMQHHGPIPRGYKVCFKDGNHRNCAIENLELLTQSQQSSKHATGANQFTRSASSRLKLLLNGEASTARELKR